jgi:hypothetical protein
MFVGIEFVDVTPGEFSLSPARYEPPKSFFNARKKGSKIGDGS